ncbi:hypothetical protein P9487_07730 [Bacillus cereus]|nr:hypothetical protein [Bacillus cereus]
MQSNKNLKHEIVQDVKLGSTVNLMEKPYEINVIVQCNWEITSYFTLEGETKLNPPIGRTCEDGFSETECVNQNAYKTLFSVDCTSPKFGLLFNYRHPATGKEGSDNVPHIVEPRCVEDENGYVFLIQIADPT